MAAAVYSGPESSMDCNLRRMPRQIYKPQGSCKRRIKEFEDLWAAFKGGKKLQSKEASKHWNAARSTDCSRNDMRTQKSGETCFLLLTMKVITFLNPLIALDTYCWDLRLILQRCVFVLLFFSLCWIFSCDATCIVRVAKGVFFKVQCTQVRCSWTCSRWKKLIKNIHLFRTWAFFSELCCFQAELRVYKPLSM